MVLAGFEILFLFDLHCAPRHANFRVIVPLFYFVGPVWRLENLAL